MVSTYTVDQVVAERVLDRLQARFVFVKASDTRYEANFNNDGSVDQGEGVKYQLPNKVNTVSDAGYAAASGDITERTALMTINMSTNAKWAPTVRERQFNIKHQKEVRIDDAIHEALASDIELDSSWQLFKNTYLFTGTAGVTPTTFKALSDLDALMGDMGIINLGERFLALSYSTASSIGFSAFPINDVPLSRNFSRNVVIPNGTTNFDQVLKSSAVVRHVAGVGLNSATPTAGLVACGTVKTNVANGANQLTLTTLGATVSDVLRTGDKLVIPSLNYLNPVFRNSTKYPLSISVVDGSNPTPLPWPTAPQEIRYSYASDGSGDLVVTFSEALYYDPTDPYRNISGQITAGMAVYLVTANTGVGSTTKIPYEANVGFNTSALMIAAPPLPKADPNDIVTFLPQLQLGMTVFQDKDITTLKPTQLYRWNLQWVNKVNPDRSALLLG